MVGLGTVVNVALILAGRLIGTAFGRFFTPRIQDSLLKATAAGILFAGISGAMGGTLNRRRQARRRRHGPRGALARNRVAHRRGARPGPPDRPLRRMAQVRHEQQRGPQVRDAFVTASLTVAVGAMSIVGAIQDGIAGD